MRGLHDLRVETRRQLALVALGEPGADSDRARRLLKRCLRDTAKLRDTEVILSIVDQLLPEYPELKHFRRRLMRQKRGGTEKTQCRLKRRKGKLSRRVTAIAAAMDRPSKKQHSVAGMAHRVSEAADNVRELSGAADRGEAKLHRARVALKRLRYLVEALGQVLPRAAAARLDALRRAQRAMGEATDLDVLADRLRKYTARRPRERRRLRRATSAIARRRRRIRDTLNPQLSTMPAMLPSILNR